MTLAPVSTYFDYKGTIIGCFVEVDNRTIFEYSRNDTGFMKDEYPHLIWVTTPIEGIDQGFRYGKVVKTRAYVWTGFNESNKAFDTWVIHSHRIYQPAN